MKVADGKCGNFISRVNTVRSTDYSGCLKLIFRNIPVSEPLELNVILFFVYINIPCLCYSLRK